MGSSLIKVENICIEEAMELLLLDNEEVIQAFSPHTTQKTFANGIGLRGLIRGSKHLDATGFRYSCKMLPEFPIIIPNQVFGYLPIWRCLPQLLRDPGIGGGLVSHSRA